MALSRQQLAAQLTALGLQPGAVVMVHASLRKLGPVQGRADGVIDGILAAIGPTGTMLMVLGNGDDEAPFDPLTAEAEADIGALAEVFRNYGGVQVSDHAAARFAAIGPHAAELLRDPPLHDYYDRGSTLDRLTERDGVVLRLGADIDTVTLTHFAEYLADVPNKRRVSRPYVRADTGPQVIHSLDDTDGIGEWPHGDYFGQILRDYVDAGRAQTGRVGGCAAELLPCRDFVDFAVAWMERELAVTGLGQVKAR